MAQQAANKLYNNFTGGLNTEASPLNYPENSFVDGDNYVLNFDGTIARRKGLDFESGYALSTSGESGYSYTLGEWRSVAGSADVNFIVVRTGRYIHFYTNDSTLSDGKHATVIDLNSYKVSTSTLAQVRASELDMAYGRGALFVVGQHIEPIYITYDIDTSVFTVTQITIEDRDFDGVDDSLEIAEEPSALSEEHSYNLINQGWQEEYITTYKTTSGSYPSNAQQWVLGKIVTPSTGIETFSVTQLQRNNTGNSAAPKGHFIRNIFNTAQSYSLTLSLNISSFSYAAGVVTITTSTPHGLTNGTSVTIAGDSFDYDNGAGCGTAATSSLNGTYTITSTGASTFQITKTITGWGGLCDYTTPGTISFTVDNPEGVVEDYRPSAVAFFAGRAWYSGIVSSRLGSRVYFSPILQNFRLAGKCYQEADPTAEDISDIIDTDGGYVTIPDMGFVKKMVPIGTNLVIFADNGVWIVSGDPGFTASGYSVRKVSNIGCIAKYGVVVAENTPMFWGDQGIYVLAEDKISGYLTAQSITIETIQSYYNAIEDAQKEAAVGVYDDLNKRVMWMHYDASDELRALVFDARLQAFYTFTLTIPGTGAEQIVPIGPVAVISNDNTDGKVKVFTYSGNVTYPGMTFATFENDTFEDWETAGVGADAPAYLITGYELLGDTMRKKAAHYVSVYLNKTEDGFTDLGDGLLEANHESSCLMQYRWDWTDHSVAGKFSPEQQVYRHVRAYQPSGASDTFNNGYPVVVTKNKVRGNGKAISVRFRTEAEKDCQILGWAVAYVGRTAP